MPATQLVRLSTPVRAVPVQMLSAPAAHAEVNIAGSGGDFGTPLSTSPGPTAERTMASKRARSAAEGTARVLGGLAWKLDSATYGHRSLYLLLAGIAVLAAKTLVIEAYVPALLVYCLFLYLLLLARLWWVRDETGAWTWRCFAERSFGAARDSLKAFFRAEELSVQYVLEQLQLVFFAAGMGLAVLAPPLGALARGVLDAGAVTEFLSTLELAGKLIFAVGFLPWLLKRLRGRSAAAKDFKQASVALGRGEALGTFPLVIDLRQSEGWSAGVPSEFHPLLSTLAQWKPRASEREAGYERSLVRFLERNVPGIDAQTQLPFEADDGTRGRIDVVLDDIVAIELKRDLRASGDADRAVGQILKYAASWRKGPVILLLVEASAEVADFPVLKRIAELREQGRSLFVVAAGRWRA